MNVTLLDTKTGEVRDCSGYHQAHHSVYWWTEGGGSCDCNRAIAFDLRDGEDHHEEQRIALGLEDGFCLRAHRWLIVDVSGDLGPLTRKQVLARANDDYPAELVARHLSPIQAGTVSTIKGPSVEV